ncbi:hypothetical protein [Nocardia ignorata]|uniref:Uncharacterized protein n=1 Tax=Nocardia ignorata TaxID=145285 RepID=A0A4R6NZK9_NOCIG|nr:hypothetical protein [Nocardia ignorata]TDP29778.1 hypothetical protein DFR75_11242 [Nocardia ignorata]
MPRTPEQREADEALTAAIDAVWAAYIDDDDPGLLTDYMVIGVRRGYDDEGDSWSQVCRFSRDDSVPEYVLLGLLEQTRSAMTRPDIVVVDDEE